MSPRIVRKRLALLSPTSRAKQSKTRLNAPFPANQNVACMGNIPEMQLLRLARQRNPAHDHRMTYSVPLKPALIMFSMLLPTAGITQQFERIETAAEFETYVVGKTLQWATGETVIQADGTTHGTMQNVGSYHGKWRWQDGYYCRSLIVNETTSEPKCLTVERAGNRLRMSYGKGEGRTLELDIKDE